MEEPILTRFDPNDQPIVSLTLSSPALYGRRADPDGRSGHHAPAARHLRRGAGRSRRRHRARAGRRDSAARAAGIRRERRAGRAGACSRRTSPRRSGGSKASLDERTIRLKGRLDAPSDFAQLVVSESNGRVVRLGDVAQIRDGTEEPRSVALYNAEEAVGIDIVKSRGYSTTAVAEEVREQVDEIQQTLPAGVTLRVVRDAGVRVEASVESVQEALLEGAALTVAVVFLFLNSWRSTVITGLALPVSVLASFVAVWAFGFTLNTMSLLGLSLAIGILIDDAIVVRENIVRHVEMGKDHYRAAFEGTNEIGLAVTATTLSIVVVFVPIAFLGGIAGQWFKPFGLTIVCSVLVSLFVSFSLDPMLSAYWPDPHMPHGAAAVDLADARPVQPLVRSPGRELQERDRVGARSPLGDDRAGDRDVRRRRSRFRCSAWSAAGSCPRPTTPSSSVAIETPPGVEPRVHAQQGGGGCRDRADAEGGSLHLRFGRRAG